MNDPPALVATYFTLAGDVSPFDPRPSPQPAEARIAAAAEAGYAGIGFGSHDLAHIRDGMTLPGLRRALDGAGLGVELEVLLDWFVDGDRRAASDAQRRLLLSAAGELGARHIKVGADISGRTWPLDHLVAEFARLCDEAAGVGTAITIELFPTSNLADLQTGRILVEAAGRANGGLLLDIWHMMRGRVSMNAIAALPPGIVNHAELNDGPLHQQGDFIAETIDRRVEPGAGEFPLPAFIDAITACGYRGPWGVEILSAAYRALPPGEAARRSFDAAGAALRRASG